MTLDVEIPRDEWLAADRLAALVVDDERSELGQVRVRADGVSRHWFAANAIAAAIVTGGTDESFYDIGLSPALVGFATTVHDDAVLSIRDDNDAQTWVVVKGDDRQMGVPDLEHEFPEVSDLVPAAETLAARATVNARALYELVDLVQVRREDVADDMAVPTTVWLQIGGGRLQATVDWSDCGPTVGELTARSVTGEVAVELNARYLRTLVGLCSPDAEIEVRIPTRNAEPVAFVCPHTTALLVPVKVATRVVTEHVEAVLEDVFGHLAVVQDDDGDYPLLRRTVPIYGRLMTSEPTPVLQVFAVLLREVQEGPALWSELNDFNANLSFARVFYVDGQVLAEVDLVAATLDAEELSVAVSRILEIATTLVPTLAAVFGGSLFEDPFDTRLRSYRNAVIEAELVPGTTIALNGSQAVAHWPFPGTVYVLTGWNPQGASLGPSVHDHVNVQIAQDVVGRGGRFVHGWGRSTSGDHAEASLVAWGIDRLDALDIGRKASQDSFFEVDAHEVRLVQCFGGEVDAWARIDVDATVQVTQPQT